VSVLTRRKSCSVRSPNPAAIPGWSKRDMPPSTSASGGTGVTVCRRCAGATWGAFACAFARATVARRAEVRRDVRPMRAVGDMTPASVLVAPTLTPKAVRAAWRRADDPASPVTRTAPRRVATGANMPSEGPSARDAETERVVRVPSALGCGEKDKKRSLFDEKRSRKPGTGNTFTNCL
jgi:hypothetical protein